MYQGSFKESCIMQLHLQRLTVTKLSPLRNLSYDLRKQSWARHTAASKYSVHLVSNPGSHLARHRLHMVRYFTLQHFQTLKSKES